jgi:hypothetical protein
MSNTMSQGNSSIECYTESGITLDGPTNQSESTVVNYIGIGLFEFKALNNSLDGLLFSGFHFIK